MSVTRVVALIGFVGHTLHGPAAADRRDRADNNYDGAEQHERNEECEHRDGSENKEHRANKRDQYRYRYRKVTDELRRGRVGWSISSSAAHTRDLIKRKRKNEHPQPPERRRVACFTGAGEINVICDEANGRGNQNGLDYEHSAETLEAFRAFYVGMFAGICRVRRRARNTEEFHADKEQIRDQRDSEKRYPCERHSSSPRRFFRSKSEKRRYFFELWAVSIK